MAGTMSGSFPGGPRKKVAAAERTRAPRLSRVEDIEERAVGGHVRRQRGRRRKRIVFAALLSVAVATAGGLYLGQQSDTSIEEVRAEMAAQQAAESGGDLGELSSEVNRAMAELWKMEDVEFQRNRR